MNTITRPFDMQFTEDELETIASAMEEFILHDDPDADPDAGLDAGHDAGPHGDPDAALQMTS